MDLTEALLVAEHPARHEMPTLWVALRVLAPIAERALSVRDEEPSHQGPAADHRCNAAAYILGGA